MKIIQDKNIAHDRNQNGTKKKKKTLTARWEKNGIEKLNEVSHYFAGGCYTHICMIIGALSMPAYATLISALYFQYCQSEIHSTFPIDAD